MPGFFFYNTYKLHEVRMLLSKIVHIRVVMNTAIYSAMGGNGESEGFGCDDLVHIRVEDYS